MRENAVAGDGDDSRDERRGFPSLLGKTRDRKKPAEALIYGRATSLRLSSARAADIEQRVVPFFQALTN